MAFIHGYIDTHNGNLGYSGDLAVEGEKYTDNSTEGWPLTGKIENVTYFRIGRHFYESLEKSFPGDRWPKLREYPRLLSETPTRPTNPA